MKALSLIVLAAGFSRRFGTSDKLFADCGGSPLLCRTLEIYKPLSIDRRLLVVNAANEGVNKIGMAMEFEIVTNTNATSGMASSIASGIHAAGRESGYLLAMGDMPYIRTETAKSLISKFQSAPANAIITPLFNGHRGHPVVFSSSFFHALTSLSGDRGAKSIIRSNRSSLSTLEVDDPGILKDIDTTEDLAPAEADND